MSAREEINKQLYDAVKRNEVETVTHLIKRGADVNTRGGIWNQWTALQYAAVYNHSKVVRILLENGCDINIKDNDKSLSASSWPVNSAPSDEWKIMETTTTAPEEVAQAVASVAENIGNEGGSLQSGAVSVVVPEGAVSIPTTFSIATYLDEQVMPPVNEEEVVVSPVVHISTSQSSHKFNKPVQLSLRPEVALKPREHETGWLLELKMSESSTEGKPSEWHTVLQLNTDTEVVVTHSPSVHYDPNTQTLYVNHFSFLVWLGKALGIRSMRDIRYVLFGQQLQLHKWKIAAHIIHGSISAYNEIAEKMKSKSYEELIVPIKDRIGLEGKVRMSIECCDPWQMVLGKAVTHIPTKRIWNCRKDAACYYEFTVQDRERSSDTLQCTVVASFEHDKQEKSDDSCDSVPLMVAHPLTKPRIREITTGDRPALDTVLDVDDDISQYAKIVRRHSDKLGGFWRGWADVPVDVIRDVSYLLTSSECKQQLAKSLLDVESGGIHRDEIVQSSDEVFTTLDLWIRNQGDKATLDRLFRFMQTVDLFEALKERLNERLKSQKPKKVGIARFHPPQLFHVVNENTSTCWLGLGLEMGLKNDQVMSTVEGTHAYKLRAIYERKRSEVGEYRAAAHLVTAVQAIKKMGSVEDDLPGVTAALAESCSYSGLEAEQVGQAIVAAEALYNDDKSSRLDSFRESSSNLEGQEILNPVFAHEGQVDVQPSSCCCLSFLRRCRQQ
ncbi:uncharacterized protein LOC134198392 isoform X2 [Corticium candelabrum]|uniref:uncharacterized protein LOC134198392 isoform X2 n=1 Tax=Corticium candelabrum TaxID=121492 RepID=UPI002E26EE32|nr:uncharacterized protein LOC134198392 isoform X2 [Corticium candelabrum]